MKCLLGLLLFRGVYLDKKQSLKDLWYSNLASRPINRACFGLKRYEWLTTNLAFHNPDTMRQAFEVVN